jgi:hypothetical protein
LPPIKFLVVPPTKLIPFQSAESCSAFARAAFERDADVAYPRTHRDIKHIDADMVTSRWKPIDPAGDSERLRVIGSCDLKSQAHTEKFW